MDDGAEKIIIHVSTGRSLQTLLVLVRAMIQINPLVATEPRLAVYYIQQGAENVAHRKKCELLYFYGGGWTFLLHVLYRGLLQIS